MFKFYDISLKIWHLECGLLVFYEWFSALVIPRVYLFYMHHSLYFSLSHWFTWSLFYAWILVRLWKFKSIGNVYKWSNLSSHLFSYSYFSYVRRSVFVKSNSHVFPFIKYKIVKCKTIIKFSKYDSNSSVIWFNSHISFFGPAGLISICNIDCVSF